MAQLPPLKHRPPAPPSGDDLPIELTGAGEPQVVADRARAARQAAKKNNRRLLAVGLGLAVLVAIAAFFTLGPGSGGDASQTTEPDATSVTWSLEVVTAKAGDNIWQDGQDTGQITPASLQLSGQPGQEFQLAVRRQDRVLAERIVTLGSESVLLDGRPALAWNAEPRSQIFEISSRPEGARVFLDDRELDGRTPLDVEVYAGGEHRLEVVLEDHHKESLAFSLDSLSDSQRDDGRLFFPLRKVTPPSRLLVKARYPVTVSIGGRRQGRGRQLELPLDPGTYRVELVAEQVFFRQTYEIALSRGQRRTLEPPAAVPVSIRAVPGNCRVHVNGAFVDVAPIPSLNMVPGRYELLFEWPGLGRSTRRTVQITDDPESILATPEGGSSSPSC